MTAAAAAAAAVEEAAAISLAPSVSAVRFLSDDGVVGRIAGILIVDHQ